VKSYQGGNADVCAIHALDIRDKHQLLIPVLNVLSINGVELEQEDRQIKRVSRKITSPHPGRINVPFGSKYKNYGNMTFEVKFRDAIPTQGLEVIPILRRFSAVTGRIVKIMQRLI